jgi:hypothetical protein
MIFKGLNMSQRASRAQALARKLEKGPHVTGFLRRPDIADLLVAAAEDRVPSVAAISRALCSEFGAETFATVAMRQLVGVAIRPVMEERGFIVVKRGVPISGDPIFKTGAIYGRASRGSSPDISLLKRFIDTLSEAELRWVDGYVSGLQQDRPSNLQKTNEMRDD